MDLRRYLESLIVDDLPNKMVFVAGPRQVGKTTIPWVYQVVFDSERDFVQDGIRCLPADCFLSSLV